ncbi:hypothetical protein WICPIJ_002534 [Wickerhamomyces pijperi]|uniref:Uncharacterized protein n=1 Tax=Wickerhamomyces pijperi TaxID=599730 RepID=A0A9P8TPR0_WICPI|nr:hypothetical protein WICPIJ_002534 [Wickerhamomyces pijperi]
MDIHDLVPFLVRHLLERAISQDTSVVDQDINTAIIVQSCLHNAFTVSDNVGLVTNGFTTSGFDLLNNGVWVFEVVDHNLGTVLGE